MQVLRFGLLVLLAGCQAQVGVRVPQAVVVHAVASAAPASSAPLPSPPGMRERLVLEQGDVRQQCASLHGNMMDPQPTRPQICAMPGYADAQVDPFANAERQAIEALPAAERSVFDRVAAVVSHDVAATNALRRLALEGMLQASKDMEGHTLLQALDVVGKQDPVSVLENVLPEVVNPSVIRQGYSGTCSTTALQIQFAREQPAEYVRVIGALAGEGTVKLRGATMTRVPGTERVGAVNGAPDPRSDSGRLFQSAAMLLGSGPGITYDIAKDELVDAQGKVVGLGLFPKEQVIVARALGFEGDPKGVWLSDVEPGASKESLDEYFAATDRGDPDAYAKFSAATQVWSGRAASKLLAILDRALADGLEALIDIAWFDDKRQPHCVVLRRLDADMAIYDNPHGTREAITRAELEARILGAVVPSAYAP